MPDEKYTTCNGALEPLFMEIHVNKRVKQALAPSAKVTSNKWTHMFIWPEKSNFTLDVRSMSSITIHILNPEAWGSLRWLVSWLIYATCLGMAPGPGPRPRQELGILVGRRCHHARALNLSLDTMTRQILMSN
jgi:hypothetical protein